MRKFMAIAVAAMLLVFGMVMTANAAEYVYYENDFSNAATLSDFTQYRGEWGVTDGQLMLTGMGGLELDQQCFLLYTKDPGVKNLTDYILEVDMLNTQSQGGPLLRCDITQASNKSSNSFYGYQMFLSYTGSQLAMGRANASDGWQGNLHVGEAVTAPGANLHLYCKVEGKNLTYIVTDKATGKEIYNHTMENDEWALGSFGFRMVIMNSGLVNLGVTGFDNLKVTAIGAVGDWLASGKSLADYKPNVKSNPVVQTSVDTVVIPQSVKVDASKLDATKTEYVFYENDFSNPATISDFTQYRGGWSIKYGGLYYNEVTSGFDAATNFSFILYSANHDANLLKNYTVEADLMNSQSAAGIITHADLVQASSVYANAFYGYLSFVANDGTKGSVGRSKWDGSWAGTLKEGESLLTHGSDYHLKVVHQDDVLTFTISDKKTGEVIWEDVESSAEWTAGTFGFRIRRSWENLVNFDKAYFDNLKVTVHGAEAVLLNAGYHPNAEIVGELNLPAAKGVELKMTLNQTKYTLNGEQKTMDVAPIIRNERTMLPVRYVAEALGAEIGWDGATSTATLKTADTEIKITVGASEAVVNGKAVKLDSPAFIENDRTYMPVRFVAETLGATVAWDGATSTATITK